MKMSTEIDNLFILLHDEFRQYKGKTTREIMKELNINVIAKNSNSVIFKKIIGSSENGSCLIKKLAEHNCTIKTINLEWNNLLKESMSLNVFKYTDLYQEKWESSTLREYFLKKTFIFVVFKKGIKDTMLDNMVIWKMPIRILDTKVKSVWEDTKQKIASGDIVRYIDSRDRFITHFLTSSDTRYIHVRPHARNKNDTNILPVKDKVTEKKHFMKHSFWLNRNFIKQIVVDGKYYE